MEEVVKSKNIFGDRFIIQEKLGCGGNANVYRAISNLDNSEVALKILKPLDKNNIKKFNKKLKRFKDEVKIVLQHQESIKGIIPILETNVTESENGEYWYSMPIATPISDFIKGIEQDKENTIIECVYNLAELLIKLHDLGIVHRDIKPSNIYFFNGVFSLGDFGLVDYPDKEDLTSTGESVGARNTMAPEFKIDGKRADGKLGDVYSLAKTMWLLLMNRNIGFDGQYNPFDNSVRLYGNSKLTHTVELDDLLQRSTENDPMARPTIQEFHQTIAQWKSIYGDFAKENQSQWKNIQKRIFGNYTPSYMEWTQVDKVVEVLNLLKYYPSLNHMFCPGGGGIDLEIVDNAGEDGFICLDGNFVCKLVKPNKLVYVSEKNDYKWSYFFLVLEEVQPVFGEPDVCDFEYLTELKPGNYDDWRLGNYGYYDDGTHLPKGFRLVHRYTRGGFVLFSKSSIYNSISQTYDGRHDKLGLKKFEQHIAEMHDKYLEFKEKNVKVKNIDNYFAFYIEYLERAKIKKNEFSEIHSRKKIYSINKKLRSDFISFLRTNSFEEEYNYSLQLCTQIKSVVFYLFFYKNNSEALSDKSKVFYILNKSFSFEKSEESLWAGIIDDEKSGLKFNNAEQIECFLNFIKERFSNNYDGPDKKAIDYMHTSNYGVMFDIKMHRIKLPSHLFTKDEVIALLKDGDNSKNNYLVVNTEGYVELVTSCNSRFITQYAVHFESFDAFNNYVGKHTVLDKRDEYLFCLNGWAIHLNRDTSVFIDHCDETEDELLTEISCVMTRLQNKF